MAWLIIVLVLVCMVARGWIDFERFAMAPTSDRNARIASCAFWMAFAAVALIALGATH